MSQMTERKIQSKIIKKLRSRGAIVVKMIVVSLGGFPDLLVIEDGRVYFIEVKRPGGKPTRRQKIVHERIKGKGVDVYVLDNDKKLI